jgi:hypothetical protein
MFKATAFTKFVGAIDADTIGPSTMSCSKIRQNISSDIYHIACTYAIHTFIHCGGFGTSLRMPPAIFAKGDFNCSLLHRYLDPKKYFVLLSAPFFDREE